MQILWIWICWVVEGGWLEMLAKILEMKRSMGRVEGTFGGSRWLWGFNRKKLGW